MAMLKLIIDLQRLYKWKLTVWHGDHGWHKGSGQIATELRAWCVQRNINFLCTKATPKDINSEAKARHWRYTTLESIAKNLSSKEKTCLHILTGHTGTDRAETLLLNLARGADLAGLSSLRERRSLGSEALLVRPILCFTRNETAMICESMQLPIWLDPTNSDMHLSRNRIRHEIFPVLEDLHPGCSKRISSLGERLSNHKEDQTILAGLAIQALQTPSGLCRKSLAKLSLTARGTLLVSWLEKAHAPFVTATQLEKISQKISSNIHAGYFQLSKGWKISWSKEFVQIEPPKSIN